MGDKLFTTRQVSGMTGIPVVTIQRYIKTYPERFSDRAKIHARGRRYTETDIRLLLWIRDQTRTKKSREKLRAELDDLNLSALAFSSPLYNLGDMIHFSHQVKTKLNSLDAFTHQLRRTHKLYTNHTVALYDFVKRQNEVIAEQAKRIQDLELQLGRRRKLTEPPKISFLKEVLYAIEDLVDPIQWPVIHKDDEES